MSQKDKDALRCSFCGKPQGEVRRLVSGPSVRICDECVRVCNEILADEGLADAVGAPRQSLGQNVGSFTCPKCEASFVLHSQHVEPAGR